MQQSAVKWLEDQIKSKHWKEMFIWQKEEVFKKANKMFEEQIRIAYMEGAFEKMRHLEGKEFMMPTEYYNQTFKSE